jgi:hypothetical protein
MAWITFYRQPFEDYADDTAFQAAWVPSQIGTATATWTLDGTHTADGAGVAAHLHIVGSTNPGDQYAATLTKTGLTPGGSYRFLRQAYADEVVAGLPANQFNTLASILTADASGNVDLVLRFTTPGGGTFDTLIWFDDITLQAEWDGQATKPVSVLIDAGVLYVGETPAGFGASQGGLRFDPHIEIRQMPFDGGRVGKAGLDWKPGAVPVITGTMIEASAAALLRYEPAMGSDGSSPVNRLTPASHGPLFVAGDYLTNVTLWCRESDGSVLRVIFPTAYVAKRSLTVASGVEGRWDIEIWGVHPPGTADLTVPPYYYEVES